MRALLLTAFVFTACRTTWPEGATVTANSGQRLCAKHSIPLVTIRAYEYLNKPGFVTLVHDASHPYWGIALERCPNIIPESVVEHPSGRMRKPIMLAYCPLCEKEFLEALRVPDKKAAVAYATYVLGIRSGTPTKGPYQVSLNGDVWTVSCFLIDGRPASISFTKSEGTEISTSFPKKYSSNQTMQRTADRPYV